MTNHRAPHKPLLLLAVMDLIAQGVIGTNFIDPSPSLVDIVDLYWTKAIGQANASTVRRKTFRRKRRRDAGP